MDVVATDIGEMPGDLLIALVSRVVSLYYLRIFYDIGRQTIPKWSSNAAIQDLNEKNPYSIFELVPHRSALTQAREWRVKCLNCPGKVRETRR